MIRPALRSVLVILWLGACGTARPQAPEPIVPARGLLPAGPPAPVEGRVEPAPPVAPAPAVAPAATVTPVPVGTPVPAPAPVPAGDALPAVAPEAMPLTPEVAPSSPAELALATMDEACSAGPMRRCVEAVVRADGMALPGDARTRVTLEQARIAAWQAVDPGAIGLLLPLTGPYAKFGEAAKEAIDLALAASGVAYRIVVRDTEGDADKAAALATELVLHERVAVLFGPIGRKESAAVATVARFYEVPQVPLASEIPALVRPGSPGPEPDGLALPMTAPEPTPAVPDPVLRLRTSPSELVTAVARHAYLELGVRRAAMLVPDTEIGREGALAFRAELERLGGVVVREVPFDPTAKDFAQPLQALLALAALPPKQRKPSKIKPDFDALFLPADALVVRRVVPFLTYWGVHPRTAPGDKSRVQLLGGGGWNHTAVVDKGEHLTDNAVFADVFSPDDPDAQDFGRRFFLHLQRRPSAFHAEAWDAARVVLDALGELARAPASADARAAIREVFGGARRLVGATGQLEVVPGGRVQPRAHLMTIDGDDIRRRFSEDEERERRTAPPAAESEPTPGPVR